MGGKTYSPVEGGSKKEAKTLACAHLLKILQQSTEISSQHNPLVSAPIQVRICEHGLFLYSILFSYFLLEQFSFLKSLKGFLYA